MAIGTLHVLAQNVEYFDLVKTISSLALVRMFDDRWVLKLVKTWNASCVMLLLLLRWKCIDLYRVHQKTIP